MVYTVNQVSKLLKVHENTVYNLIAAKKIEAVKVGKVLRITEESLNSFIQANSTTIGGK